MGSSISVSVNGKFQRTESWLSRLSSMEFQNILSSYGEKGVAALAATTPIRSGVTAQSWQYRLEGSRGNWSIIWYNTNVNQGVNIAVILQYGHGTRNGGFVRGRDYINPAIQGVFDAMVAEIDKVVKIA